MDRQENTTIEWMNTHLVEPLRVILGESYAVNFVLKEDRFKYNIEIFFYDAGDHVTWCFPYDSACKKYPAESTIDYMLKLIRGLR